MGGSVARWVAAYRRHGMAALRGEAAATGPRRWIEACLHGRAGLIGARCAAAVSGQNGPFARPGPGRRARGPDPTLALGTERPGLAMIGSIIGLRIIRRAAVLLSRRGRRGGMGDMRDTTIARRALLALAAGYRDLLPAR